MSTIQPSEAVRLDQQDERACRAERLAKMFARWEMEDVSDEPNWEVEYIEPAHFRGIVIPSDDDAGTV